MLAGWAEEPRMSQDRLLLVNLRGRRNPCAQAEGLARLAELLRVAAPRP